MSAEDDALREMAANRGCKLVKSRRRKPGGDFGRYGLKDAKTGKQVLGFGARGLTATAQEIESFLRGGAAASCKSSLGAAADAKPAPAKRKGARPTGAKRKAAKSPRAEPTPRTRTRRKEEKPPEPLDSARDRPEAPRPPEIREARPRDAAAIAALLTELGYEVSAVDVRRRLAAMGKAGEPALVADRDGPIGCLSWHVTPVLHRPRPVGRITMIVVAETARGGGIGTALVEAAEARLRARGCGLLEVTSNVKRMRAHAFYQGLGFERTSYRFAKPLVG